MRFFSPLIVDVLILCCISSSKSFRNLNGLTSKAEHDSREYSQVVLIENTRALMCVAAGLPEAMLLNSVVSLTVM